MNKTDIEYLDYSWNPTHGCSAISPGCAHCWAKATSKRLAGMNVRGYLKSNPFAVTCCPWKLDEPLKIKKPSRIGVSFMGDLFHEDVPTEFIEKVMLAIYDNSQHTFLILTKRPDRLLETRVRNFFLNCFMNKTGNIWLGITAENQEMLDRRIEIILEVKRLMQTLTIFVSIEPMLGAISLARWCHPEEEETAHIFGETIDWAIFGAESGPKRRECKIENVRYTVRQCNNAGIPVFIKQLDINGELSKNPAEWPEDLRIREYPT